MRVTAAAIPVAAAMALSLSGCGMSGDPSDAARLHHEGRGPITYVQGKDNTGDVAKIVAKWNAGHPRQKVTLKEQTDEAEQQHQDLVQHFQSKDPSYDVVSTDVVWTAEFAAHRWLQPLTGRFAVDTRPLLPAAVRGSSYRGKLYAAPFTSDGALLYYRKDLVPRPPRSWAELRRDCAVARAHHIACYAGQFAKYEGLTVNVTEAINSAGGHVMRPDGVTPDVDTPAARRGLSFLVDAYRRGDIPRSAITYQEEQGRQAFEDGRLLFLRNYSYVYNLAKTDDSSRVKRRFGVTRVPGPNGPGNGTLGGHAVGLNVYSRHKATASDFMRFLESEPIQREVVTKESNAPVLKRLYHDPKFQANEELGYLPALGRSLETSKTRPVTPFYPDVTAAIEENAYAAIKGAKSVPQATRDMQAAITAATSQDS